MDTQLLNISKEELPLKRKHIEQIEKSEEDFNSSMNKVFKSNENIRSCIQETVVILAHLATLQTPYPQQYQPPFSPSSFNKSGSINTLPREISSMKIRGMKKTRQLCRVKHE